MWRAIWFPSAPAAVGYKFPQSTDAARPGRTGLFGTGIPASAAVGRERGNPRTERSEAAALKVQLCAVPALRAVGVHKSPCVPSLGAGDSGSCSLSLGTNAASLAGRTFGAEPSGPRAGAGRSPALAMFSSRPVLQQRDTLADNQRATTRAQASGFLRTQSREVQQEASKFQKVPRLRELRITYVFKRSCAPSVARNLV